MSALLDELVTIQVLHELWREPFTDDELGQYSGVLGPVLGLSTETDNDHLAEGEA